MHTFFHGWRRKAGCVTLVVACALMVMWMRSRLFYDQLVFNAPSSSYCIGTIEHRLCFGRGSMANKVDPTFEWSTTKNQHVVGFRFDAGGHQIGYDPYEHVVVQWRFDWYGLQMGAYSDQNARFLFCLIPLTAIAIPLTLLSVYLILWKPRKQSPTASKPDA